MTKTRGLGSPAAIAISSTTLWSWASSSGVTSTAPVMPSRMRSPNSSATTIQSRQQGQDPAAPRPQALGAMKSSQGDETASRPGPPRWMNSAAQPST